MQKWIKLCSVALWFVPVADLSKLLLCFLFSAGAVDGERVDSCGLSETEAMPVVSPAMPCIHSCKHFYKCVINLNDLYKGAE